MKLALILALLAITALAMWRIGRQRPLLLLLQPAAALLLCLAVFPPATEQRAGTLVIATADTRTAQVAAHRSEGRVLALPEAPPLPDVEAVPDLATALRRYPGLARVQVLGAGLTARDREAVAARALAFDAAPLPAGLVELSAPSRVVVGSGWTVSGRVQSLAKARVELRDPGGRLLTASDVDANGRFSLAGVAPSRGRMSYSLDLRIGKTLRERIELPMQVQSGRRASVWLLAGGPGPEMKYLQRWALDAGLDVRSQASLGAGLRAGDSLPALDTANLAKLDLLVLDERAWRGLGDAGRRAVREAVDQGLGLMLRITGPISQAERKEWSQSGFLIADEDGPLEVSLDGIPVPTLLRQPLRASADDAVPLLLDARGRSLGLWRAQGRGRIGLWWLGESYRLSLAGQQASYAGLWSEAFGTLARADAAALPYLWGGDPRPQQRAVVCGLAAPAFVTDSSGHRERLLPDPSSGAGDCAAWWPARAGWHRIGSEASALDIYVRATDEAKGLQAQELREQTQRLVSPGNSTSEERQAVPGPRWPWFLAWLLVSALGWALERRFRISAAAAS